METMVKVTEMDFGSKKDKQFISRVRNSQREMIWHVNIGHTKILRLEDSFLIR